MYFRAFVNNIFISQRTSIFSSGTLLHVIFFYSSLSFQDSVSIQHRCAVALGTNYLCICPKRHIFPGPAYIFEPAYDKACAICENSDQPAHPRSLIRVFDDHICLLQHLGYPKKDKREPLPYWVDIQADLSLCRAHRSYCSFVVWWHISITIRAATWVNVPSDICAQRRLKSACAVWSESAWRNFATLAIKMREMKILMRVSSWGNEWCIWNTFWWQWQWQDATIPITNHFTSTR